MLSTSSSSPWDFEKDRPGILWTQILRFPTTLAQCYQARVLARPLSTEVDPSRYFFPRYLTSVSQPFLQPRKKARKNATVIGLALSVFASTLRPMYAARFYVDGELVRPGRRLTSSKQYSKMRLYNLCSHNSHQMVLNPFRLCNLLTFKAYFMAPVKRCKLKTYSFYRTGAEWRRTEKGVGGHLLCRWYGIEIAFIPLVKLS